MATLATQQLVAAGTAPTFVAAAAGLADKFQPGGFLVVKNGGGSPMTVTIDSKVPCNQGADHDIGPLTVAAGAERWIPVKDVARFQGSDGLADVTYSAVTSVTVACVIPS